MQLTRTQTARVHSRRSLTDVQIQVLFIAPTIILLVLWNIFPLFYSLYLSFTEFSVIKPDVPPAWIGLQNYNKLLSDPRIWQYFTLTGRYVVTTVALQAIVGFGLALFLRERFKGSGLITTLILIPIMMSPVVIGLFWKLIYNPAFGIFNYLIGYSVPNSGPDWLGEGSRALWAIIIVDVWMWSPFVMLLCLSGLKAIPDYLYEAAAIDRASPWFQFWRITLPQVAPLLLIAILFRTIEAFKTFDLVMGLTGGGPGDATELIAVHLYRAAFTRFTTGESSALAYIILVIVIAVSNLYVRSLNRIRGENH
ncbi:MAG: sugar ABC transporter permease [Chloroflexi bacterium]|jgi:multiple sugar transport system permease protein|uniref:ABC transporter permease n=1 Tax=Candidatus Thermofonsia Clade 3 bacterium TaxID=2364212 RepID=A0A2M8QCJ5_9CHLR|nr:sugar ABC transporter permease [Candidatus Roseilinea sp. NK_OTU-006]PJF47521.1 MAG: ABC transporter permease [Candidatus Thermofonsia Clade 3 bacterium]RMG63900.1 MAG: sugar ABC transporter permease [Chloroflexota bacterium]